MIITISILGFRLGAITSGKATTNDTFLLGLFVALMLVPIFSEMEFLGIKLKQEIEDLKTSIRIQFGEIKNDIRNNQNQTFNATIHGFGPPPSDSKLPELVEEIEIIKSNSQFAESAKENDDSSVPTDNVDLFIVRYKIERIINDLFTFFFPSSEIRGHKRRVSLLEQVSQLTQSEIITSEVKPVLPKILAICNYAIHGEHLSRKQIDFVKDNAEVVISALNSTYDNRDML